MGSEMCIRDRNVIVNYDVFNRNRKWSDEDITLLTILGHCIGNLLNYSE